MGVPVDIPTLLALLQHLRRMTLLLGCLSVVFTLGAAIWDAPPEVGVPLMLNAADWFLAWMGFGSLIMMLTGGDHGHSDQPVRASLARLYGGFGALFGFGLFVVITSFGINEVWSLMAGFLAGSPGGVKAP